MMNDLAYIAGFWEGEGHAGIYNNGRKNGKIMTKKDRYRLEVGINNTNQEVLEWIKEKMGYGNVKVSKRENRRDIYIFRVRDRNARNFLESIYPFLKFRKDKVKPLIMGDRPPYSILSARAPISSALF